MTRNLLNSKKTVKVFKSGKEANLWTLVRDYYSLAEDGKRDLSAMISQFIEKGLS
jgi:hypothetical protein